MTNSNLPALSFHHLYLRSTSAQSLQPRIPMPSYFSFSHLSSLPCAFPAIYPWCLSQGHPKLGPLTWRKPIVEFHMLHIILSPCCSCPLVLLVSAASRCRLLAIARGMLFPYRFMSKHCCVCTCTYRLQDPEGLLSTLLSSPPRRVGSPHENVGVAHSLKLRHIRSVSSFALPPALLMPWEVIAI